MAVTARAGVGGNSWGTTAASAGGVGCRRRFGGSGLCREEEDVARHVVS
jgi:hypothetical protein